MKARRGFTLMELMVVLLIIGILSTVALRTIDATHNRALFDQTTKQMTQFVQAITGNPSLYYDGRRTDLGFVGDMERLPDSLKELLDNPGGAEASSLRGPYLHVTNVPPETSDLFLDGWGDPLSLNYGRLTSGGGGKSITMSLADSVPQLFENTISGTITDVDNNPPDSANAANCTLKLWYNNPTVHAGALFLGVVPNAGGFYQFLDTVPMGIHKLTASIPGETLTRYVTVEPRSHTVVDLKLTKSFFDKVRIVGSPQLGADGASFQINIANNQTDNVTISSFVFKAITPDTAYMRDFQIGPNEGTNFPLPPGGGGKGVDSTVQFSPVTIAPNLSEEVPLMFREFHRDPYDTSALAQVSHKQFTLLFDDGSEIKFTVP